MFVCVCTRAYLFVRVFVRACMRGNLCVFILYSLICVNGGVCVFVLGCTTCLSVFVCPVVACLSIYMFERACVYPGLYMLACGCTCLY